VDRSITESLNGLLTRHDWLEDPIGVFEHLGEVLFVGILLALLVLGGRALRRAAVSAGAATALALVVGQIISRLVDRQRPFVAHHAHVHLFSPHVADPGFPSDHATGAFAIAAAVWGYDRRFGAALLVLAAGLAVGRVALGFHYPTDVLAGAVLGVAAAAAVRSGPVRSRLEGLADRVTGRPAFRPRAL
jgi:undecaprenyl-diphosphatase